MTKVLESGMLSNDACMPFSFIYVKMAESKSYYIGGDKMKKFLTVLCAVAMMMTLCACGSNNELVMATNAEVSMWRLRRQSQMKWGESL